MPLDLETISVFGRKRKEITYDVVRPLNEDDFEHLKQERGVQKNPSRVRRLSERHRNLARILASGKPDWEAAIITGYTEATVSVLRHDPAFSNLVRHYSEERDLAFLDVQEKMAAVNGTALDELQDRLELEPEAISTPQLLEIVKVTSDRTGNGPQSSNTQVNINVNMASRLEAARKRIQARVIDAKVEEVPNDGHGVLVERE